MSDQEFFAEFDRYCEENNISEDEAPMAFAAFLNRETGWDGDVERVLTYDELREDRDRWQKHANDLGDLLAKREDEIARLRAEPPTDGDRISKAIDAAFKETYPDQLKRGTVMYHKLKNAIIENLAPEPPTDGDPKCTTNHDEIIRCYSGNDDREIWAKHCPTCGALL